MKTIVALVSLLTSLTINASEFEDNKKSCDNGDAVACYNVGVDFTEGVVVTKSKIKANEYYNRQQHHHCHKIFYYLQTHLHL